jgi:hypothetical protein
MTREYTAGAGKLYGRRRAILGTSGPLHCRAAPGRMTIGKPAQAEVAIRPAWALNGSSTGVSGIDDMDWLAVGGA